MKTLLSTLILGGSLVLGGCGNKEEVKEENKSLATQEFDSINEIKRNTEIELYNQLLENYMVTEDLNFQNIIAHYKRNVTELKECRDNKTLKEDFNGLKYNRGVYEIELKHIKKYSEIREAGKKEILDRSKRIKRKFDEY